MKTFNDYKYGDINESVAPFYQSGSRITAILDSDQVAAKMGMQAIDYIKMIQTSGQNFVYILKTNHLPEYEFKVTLASDNNAMKLAGEGGIDGKSSYRVVTVDKLLNKLG